MPNLLRNLIDYVDSYLPLISYSSINGHHTSSHVLPDRFVLTLLIGKLSEFRNWLLFYSLPLLVNYLPPLYFHHFALLVCSMHLLLQKQVTPIMCNAAEEMLQDFYKLVPELYGISMCTMNVHSLIHLPYFVRLWGPLWTQSAFCFESMNGNLTGIVHSTRKIAEQLSFSLDINQSLHQLSKQLEEKESEQLLNYIIPSHHSRSNMTNLWHGYAIGLFTSYTFRI